MEELSKIHVGLDVHKDSISVAAAEPGRAPGRLIGKVTHDVNKLLKVLQSLVDKGNTVIVIEHNLDVIKEADWLIDLGPEGGDGGGTIVTQGTPEQVAECEASWTGKFLKPML